MDLDTYRGLVFLLMPCGVEPQVPKITELALSYQVPTSTIVLKLLDIPQCVITIIAGIARVAGCTVTIQWHILSASTKGIVS